MHTFERPGSRAARPAAADHSVLGTFNVVATVSLLLIVAGAAVIAARHRHTGQYVTVPEWLAKVPVAVPAAVGLLGLAGLIYSYAALY